MARAHSLTPRRSTLTRSQPPKTTSSSPLPSLSTSNPSPFSTSALLSPSLVPASLDEVEDGLILTLSAPLKVASPSLQGSFTLIVDQPLSIDASLTISPQTIVRVRNAELTVSSIACHGLLSLELASLTSSALPPSSSPSQGTLHVAVDALLLSSGPGGSNHLHRFDVQVDGGLVAINAPLLLDHSRVNVGAGAAAVMANELVSVEGPDGVSAVVVSGILTVTGEGKQLLVVPLRVEESGLVRLTGASYLSLLSPLHCAGQVVLSQQHRLVTSAPVTLAVSSIVELRDAALVHVQSNTLLNAGAISSADGAASAATEVAISAFLNNTGTLRVARLLLKEGGVLGVDDATTALASLTWAGGLIAGRGFIAILDGRVTGASPAPKILDGVALSVRGGFTHEARSAALLRGAAQMTVEEAGTLTLKAGATVRCDDDRSALTVLGALVLDSTTDASAEDATDAAPATALALPLISHGQLTLVGSGTAALHRTSVVDHIRARGAATLTLQATAEAVAFTFTGTVDMSGADSRSMLLLQNANVSFTYPSPPRIDTLDIRDGRVRLSAGLQARVCRVGSAQSPGELEGDGKVAVDELHFNAGRVAVDALNVRRRWVVERPSAKSLDVRNVTLLAGSSGRVASTLLAVSSSTFIDVEAGATLALLAATTVFSANDTGTAERRVATVRVREGGLLLFEGSGQGASSLQVDALLEGGLVVNNTNSGVFTIALRGVSSSPGSSLRVSPASTLVLGCPTDFPSDCSYGALSGEGTVVVSLGSHLFPAAINVASLAMSGGRAHFLAPVAVDSLALLLGDLVLDSSLSVNRRFTWTGGAVHGSPLLGSSLLVQAGGRAVLDANSTSTLDGVALLVGGSLVWKRGDMMMRNVALLRIKEGGELLVDGEDGEAVRVVSDSSTARLEVEGSAVFQSPASVQVAVVSTGRVLVTNDSSVTWASDYIQDGSLSSLQVDAGSELVKLNGGLLIVRGRLTVDGVVHGTAEVGGRLVIGGQSAGGQVDGDMLLTPSSIVSMPRTGRPLSVNGSVHAAGTVEVEGGERGVSYPLISANSTTGAFALSSNHRMSYEAGAISVTLLPFNDSASASNEARPSPLSFVALYLPFIRLPESLSTLASAATDNATTECAAVGQSARKQVAMLAALASLSFVATGLALCLGCVWWSKKRRGGVSGGGERRLPREAAAKPSPALSSHCPAVSPVEKELEQQRQEDAAVAFG